MLSRLAAATLALAAMLLCAAGPMAEAEAQILVPDVVKPYTPIVGRCDCVVPKDATVTLDWRADPLSEVLTVLDAKGLENVHVWAPPGEHWLEVTVITQYFREITVWVPDDKDPNDITKAKLQKLKITDRYDIQRFEKTYKVLGSVPVPPGPGPDPGPGPQPPPGPSPGGFAGEALKWARDAGMSKADLSLVGDNYLSIGSQGSDPARSSGWDLQAFTTNTKRMNLDTVGVDKLAAYKGKFFDALAVYQNELYKARGLKSTDRAKIAELWTETGTALKAAAAVMQ